MSLFLGIDTSGYTTSCAVVNEGFQVVCSARKLLTVALGERGLRQSEAVFAHTKQLPRLLEEVLGEVAPNRLAAICASARPVDADTSYMPVFKVGSGYAAAVAAALRVPCYETSHQQGHLAAARIGLTGLPERYLALHLSGGTTDLLLVEPGKPIQLIGRSGDLHAGQLVDRVGVSMGLPFPAGSALEQLAARGTATGRYPVACDGTQMHLSGAEAQALRDVEEGRLLPVAVAAEVFDFISRSIHKVLATARKVYACADVLLFGGVASSELLRKMLKRRAIARRSDLNLWFGKPEYSGDNAAGVAIIGARTYYKNMQEEQHG